MAHPRENLESATASGVVLGRIGVVVHPSRDVEQPLDALRRWAAQHDVELAQVEVDGGQRQRVAPSAAPESCDLVVSIGGDGTMLAATRAALPAARPVLGVACGSLGALTSVAVDGVASALDRFDRGAWEPRSLPALQIEREGADELLALNDIAVVRAGQGQIRTRANVDGDLFGRFAGDGCIVSTPIGSSAYALAAGGPLLAPSAEAFLLTPLSAHGGFCPPLVLSAKSHLELEIGVGHGGARVELDGQVTDLRAGSFRIGLRTGVATVVTFSDQESILAGLRRRQIIIDSPRILADEGPA